MSETNFTPGPWRWNKQGHLRGKDGNYIINPNLLRARAEWSGVNRKANARLIAAAPDQNAALVAAPELPAGFTEDMTDEECLEWLLSYADWWRDVRAPAIAKATGR